MKRALFLLICSAALAAAQTINCGVPVDGLLQPTGLVDPSFIPKPTTVTYVFSAQAGDAILLRLLYDTTDKNFNPTVTVYSPAGAIKPRGTPSFGGGGSTQAGEFDLPITGNYQIDVQLAPNAQTKGGPFRLVMTRLNRPCSNAVLSCGSPAKGQLSDRLDIRSYQVDAKANDVISFRMVKTGPFAAPNAPASARPPDTNLALVIFGPDGKTLNTFPGGRTAAVQQSGFTRLGVDVVSPLAGTVTALVYDQNNNPATFALSAIKLTGGCSDKSLSCGVVQDAAIKDALQVDAYGVTAEAGDVFSVKIARSDSSGQFLPSVEVYDPSGNVVTTVAADQGNAHTLATGTFNARTAGRYAILASDGADLTQTGGYSIVVNRINRPCNPVTSQSLGCSTILEGGLQGLLRQNTYTISAAANDSFLIRLLRTGANTTFRPRVDIYDPQGRTVQNATTADLTRVNFTVPGNGNYTVVVSDSFDGGQSGTYTLSSLRLNKPCGAAPLDCGKVMTGSIDGALRSSAFAYNADPGDSFTVRLLNPGGGLQPDIEIYDPQGNRVGTDVSGNAKAVDVSKPGGGSYTVVALDSNANPGRGAFAIQLLRTRNACGSSPGQGQSVRGLVSGTAPFVTYSMPVTTGDVFSVRSASFTSGFNAFMEVYDEEGVRVDSGTYSVTRRASAGGTYTVLVGAQNPRSAGSYSLSWQLLNNPVNATALVCGGTASGSLAAQNEYRYYVAGLSNNDIMKLLLTPSSDNFTPQVEVYDPAGTRLNSGSSEIVQRVRGDGNYLVIVTPASASGESGTYSLALQRPNNPCSPASLACGQSLLRRADVPGQIDAIGFNGTAGDLITLRIPVRSGNFAPFAELYNDAGTLVRGTSSGTLAITLPSTGRFTVFVRDRNGTGTGSYRVALQTDPACAVDDKEAPSIQLVQPTGGEVIAGGSTFRVAWQSDDNVDVASHEVRLSTDGGKTFPTVVAGSLSGAAQSFDWPVPASIAPTRTAMIRVTATDAAGNSQSATSDLLAVIGSGFTENTSIRLSYDSLNRITEAAFGDGRTVQYTYDGSGNLVRVAVTGQ